MKMFLSGITFAGIFLVSSIYANTFIASNIEVNADIENTVSKMGYLNPSLIVPQENYFLLNVMRSDQIVLLKATWGDDEQTDPSMPCYRQLTVVDVKKILYLEGYTNEFFTGIILMAYNKAGLSFVNRVSLFSNEPKKTCLSPDTFNDLIAEEL